MDKPPFEFNAVNTIIDLVFIVVFFWVAYGVVKSVAKWITEKL